MYAYREALNGYISKNPEEANDYLKEMLAGEFQIIHRLAINAINTNYHILSNLLDKLLDKKYLDSHYQHEMWHLLNQNYEQFSEPQKERVLTIILEMTREDDEGNIHDGSTAYQKAIWLASIRVHGNREANLYNKNIALAKTEPDHPDFSCYTSTGWGGNDLPIPLEDLQGLSLAELVSTLKNFVDPGGFRRQGIEGLAKTFKQVVKAEPLRFYTQLNQFIELDLAYIYEIIVAFKDLWTEKAKLPWDDIWPCLLNFCLATTKQGSFWESTNAKQREAFVANRYWVVSAIGQLVVVGTKSDENAFSEEYLDIAEDLIVLLLTREVGNEYKIESDAVSISINSSRGQCIEALINLTLRSCRLSDKKRDKDHSDVWEHFQQFYDAELDRADMKDPEYEFATLVTNYLPNFLYMSKEWVLSNLSRIFQQDHYLKWLCAMQGYTYVGTIYQEVFQYLKDHGDFLKVLDDVNVKDRIEERVIQKIAIAYINDFESYSDENSLINTVISKNDPKELNQLIWFIWSLRKKDDEKLKNKVFKLWPIILKNTDLSTKKGRRMASQLCHWAVFIDQIDHEKMEILLAIAPYADEEHNSYELLTSIAKLSQKEPFEVQAVWMRMLEGFSPGYPEEAIKQILGNLAKDGQEGLRKAKDVVSEYVKKGNDQPAIWLREICSGL